MLLTMHKTIFCRRLWHHRPHCDSLTLNSDSLNDF